MLKRRLNCFGTTEVMYFHVSQKLIRTNLLVDDRGLCFEGRIDTFNFKECPLLRLDMGVTRKTPLGFLADRNENVSVKQPNILN